MVLSVLSGILSGISGNARLAAIQTAGQAQLDQAAGMFAQNMQLNGELGKILNQASTAATISNAAAGQYSLTQKARATLFQTQLGVALQWIQSLKGGD